MQSKIIQMSISYPLLHNYLLLTVVVSVSRKLTLEIADNEINAKNDANWKNIFGER